MSQASRVRLTAGRVESFTCPPEKSQAFLWDTDTPTLALRATPTGRKVYVFEARVAGKTVRIPIGAPADWSLQKARERAQDLKRLTDDGLDPREVEREKAEAKAAAEAEKLAAQVAAQAEADARALTVGEIWPQYLELGRPKRKADWKPRYRADLEAMASPGGQPKKRGEGLTRPGPLFPLMSLALADVNEDALKVWFDREAVAGPHQAARALMMFRGFLRWCASRPEYRRLTDRDAGRAPAILDSLPSNTSRDGSLETSQVPAWWESVSQMPNPVASAYLRALLLVGARREEMAALKWTDVDWRWRKMTLADKVGDTRTIPLGPYMAQMLAGLPRAKFKDGTENPYVFAANSESGHIEDPRSGHGKALEAAGLGNLSFHDLRRSFNIVGEAAGAPEGAIAQISGHRPSGTAEKYKPRTIEGLRPFLERIEGFICELVGVEVPSASEAPGLRVVSSR